MPSTSVAQKSETPEHEAALQLDLDGLTFNTERPQRRVYMNLVREHLGVETTARDYAWAQGKSREATVAGLNERFGKLNLRDASVLEAHSSIGEFLVASLVQTRKFEMKTQGIELMPHAAELLDMADRGNVRRGIATSRAVDVAREMLESAQILPRVHSVVGKGTPGVFNVKPAPDIPLVSAAELRRKPQDCWGLDDAPDGVTGMAAAGVKTIYVADLEVAGIDPAARRLAKYTVRSLEQAISILQRELGI